MKNNKKFQVLFWVIILVYIQDMDIKSQVTIGSAIPPEKGALLDIKEKRANIATGNLETAEHGGLLMPRVLLSDSKSLAPLIDSSYILANTAEYANLKQLNMGLMVYNLTVSTQKNLSRGLYKWDGDIWNKIADTQSLTDSIKHLRNTALSYPAVFMLNNNISNFLSTTPAGVSQSINMVEVKNTIPDYVKLSANGTSITFEPGFYLIDFTYEATHNANCNLSSYFIDFPDNSGLGLRIHTNSSHSTFSFSNHGGTVSAPCILTSPTVWNIALGRGQAGTCTGAGMTLEAQSTFIFIIRYPY